MLASLVAASLFTQASVTAFVEVDVIPMDRERVLRRQTVLVRDGLIAEIGDSGKVKVPADAQKIDGKGKFLIPGLSDMHVHLYSDEEMPDSMAGDEFMVMVANGVTSVRMMCGTPELLDHRAKIDKGDMIGPKLFVASPQLVGRNRPNGFHTTNAEQARAAVQKSKLAGYDFIKLTDFITPEVYDATIDEARKQGIRVIGHVDVSVGAEKALAAGQHVEHLDAYLESVLKDGAPMKRSISGGGIFRPENWESIDYIDDAKIRKLAETTAKSGTYSTPTLNFWKVTFGVGASDEEIKAYPDFPFVPEYMRKPWFSAGKRIWASPPSEVRRKRFIQARNLMVKEIHRAGGKIMAGSDSPDWFMVYGFSLHRELRCLVEAGLTPFQALEAATRVPAEFLGGPFGTIKKGNRADLVLLDANPLDKIGNTEHRSGVMLRGNWFSEATLKKSLEEAATRFAKVTPGSL
ncbi:MAG: amidohydrolase family protein [Chlorobia bacterium]|nr:amidohydrolase family protein [Fimbriimonadaceae bacterium]